jgi:hypothetical protein
MVKLCKTCHLPTIVSRDQVWNPNGTIVATEAASFRLAIMEWPEFSSLYSNLQKTFGDVIPTCFTQGTRKNAKTYIDGLLSGPIGYVARSSLGSRKAYDSLIDTCLGLGYGRPTITDYKRKKSITVEIVETVYPPLFLGDHRGAFEAVDRVPTRGRYETISKTTTRFMVEATEKEDPLEDRFNTYDKTLDLTGRDMDRCETCGLPSGLTRFKWDTEKFHILDTMMGERVFLFGFNDLTAILHELETLVGDMMRSMVRDLTLPFGRDIGRKLGAKAFELTVEDMRLKGMGLAKYEQDGNKVHWEIRNPFYTPILDGKLSGIYESVIGRAPKVELKREATVLTINMS